MLPVELLLWVELLLPVDLREVVLVRVVPRAVAPQPAALAAALGVVRLRLPTVR